jgi:hypothetical protein
MKFSKTLIPHLSIFAFAIALMATFTSYVASAHPYASSFGDTNAAVNQGFGQPVLSCYLNEAADTVTVIFDQGLLSASTNIIGASPKGLLQFPAPGGFTTFQVIVSKVGTGSPTLISDDANVMSSWTNGSGFAVNHNPKNAALFGRLYAAQSLTFSGKTQGIYSMNPDQSYITNVGPAIPGMTNTWVLNGANPNYKSPGRLRIAPNNKLLVADDAGANSQARIYLFEADLSSATNLLGASPSTLAGDVFGTPVAFGSLETGDLVLYVPSSSQGVPNPGFSLENTNCIRGPNTGPGDLNCIYRFNIGSGPIPWNKRPDWAYTVGLNGIAQLRPEVDVTADGTIYAGFGRANLSNPNIQILAPVITTNSPIALALTNNVDRILALSQSPTNWFYTSGVNPPDNVAPASDPWNGSLAAGAAGTYGGVRVSPDGVFFASFDNDNALTIANLTNRVPDDGSIFTIISQSATGNQAGMDWDAADNIWAMSRMTATTATGAQLNSPNARLRCYSLGLTTTCVSSNDWTGTNGSFAFTLPGATASVVATTPTGSQNYTNNPAGSNPGQRPGDSTPAVFTITLNQSTLAAPVVVNFVRTGTAVYGVNYQMLTNLVDPAGGGYFTNADGVAMNTNSVIFPAGTQPGGGNWHVALQIKPTSTPVSGPTLTVAIRLLSGTTYSAKAPVNGTVAILNTGPQLLQLSAAAPATAGNMNRGIPNDSARFTLTRLGDTNGPGNDSVASAPTSFTVTNFTYLGTANFTLDYTARAQRFTGANAPVDGSPGILIPPGPVTITGMIGNPVKHTDTSLKATNLTVIFNLTNSAANPGTNLVSSENLAYQVNQTVLTLNEFDNAVGGETVVWSNPLTNSLDSTNWTAVFANVNLFPSPILPTVISNYDNSRATVGSEGFIAAFGKSVNDAGNDGGVAVPPSDTMTANGWTTALKVSVNKNPGNQGEAGINLYPTSGTNQGTAFHGNYALRFDMYLSLYNAQLAVANTANREFAAFGINHRGTNANWRLDSNPRPGGTGSFPINGDGEWACINAGLNSITPADWDLFIGTAFSDPIFDTSGTNVLGKVNTNLQFVPYSLASFRITPFTNAVQTSPGVFSGVTNIWGNNAPVDDVFSLNNNAFGGTVANGIIKSPPFGGITNTSSGQSVGGAPVGKWVDVSFEMTRQTNLALLVARQEIFHVGLTNGAFGTRNQLAPHDGVPMLGYLDPNSDLSFNNAFVYYSNMRIVELSPFIPWTNQPVAGLIVTQGASFSLSSAAIYASNPLTNTWYRGTTNGPDAAGARDNGTPTAALQEDVFAATNGSSILTVSSIQSGTNYLAIWKDVAGSVTGFVTVVEVIAGPGDKTVSSGITTNLAVVPTGNAPPTSFQWKRGGTNLVNGTQAGRVSSFGGVTTATLSITNVQAADAGVYSNLVVNANGNVVAQGTLTVINPPTSVVVTPAATNRPWGSPVTFTVSASGDTPFTYQWKRGGNNISGATDSAFTINAVTGADGGAGNAYTAGVTNAIAGAISSAGILTVAVLPYTIGQNVVLSGGIVSMSFTTANSFDTSSAFVLQSCGVVDGTYTNAPGVSITGPTGGPFSVTAPQTAAQMFYRLNHVP